MFTTEEHATRALGAALHHDRDFAVSWLRSAGVGVGSINKVAVEFDYTVPGTKRRRRADVHIEFEPETVDHDGATGVATEVVIVEAKIDALVDDEQLADAHQVADHVVCLLPDELPRPADEEVVTTTWEALVAKMRAWDDGILAFLAEQFVLLVDSPRVRRRRRLAKLLSTVRPPRGWTVDPSDGSTSGNALGVFYGPSRGDHKVRVEVANEQRGRDVEPYAYVLVCSEKSPIDPVVIDTLVLAELPMSQTPHILYQSGTGRRAADEREALDSAGVSKQRTYGYGRKQLKNAGWSGYGPVVFCTKADYSEDEVGEWLRFTLEVGRAMDKTLAQVKPTNVPDPS